MHTVSASLKKHLVRGIFALLLLHIGGANAAALTQGSATKDIVPDHLQHVYYDLLDTAAVSSNNVWAVGNQRVPKVGTLTLIEHWDGTQWSIITSPTENNDSVLYAVTAIAGNDVWAVGSATTPRQTLIEHWDGTQWSIIPSPNPGVDNVLQGVTAISTNDVWAVGEFLTTAPPIENTLVEHWDGTQWSTVASPNPSDTSYLYGVTAVSATDIWATGYYGNPQQPNMTLTEHWNGTQWSIVPSPSTGTLAAVAAVSSNDIWAVGSTDGSSQNQLIEHWDGSSWSIIPGPSTSGILNSVATIFANDVWTTGYSFSLQKWQIEHWDGTQWSIVKSPKVNGGPDSVAAINSNDVWAVGDRNFKNKQQRGQETLTEHWNGTKWSIVPSPN